MLRLQKKKGSQISNLTLYLKELEENKLNSKVEKGKQGIEKQQRKPVKPKINKTNKPLARLTKERTSR